MAAQVGKMELAVQLIQRAIAVEPAVAEYHSNLGSVFTSLNRLPEALAALQRAVDIDPQNFGAQLNLANAHLAMRHFAEAADAARAALRLNPNQPEAHYNLEMRCANSVKSTRRSPRTARPFYSRQTIRLRTTILESRCS
jgi:tetratricopeptide (TPR) repeat protein